MRPTPLALFALAQFALALFTLALAPTGAFAAASEDAYLAARDAAIARIKKLAAKKDAEDVIGKEQEKALADLQNRLQAIVGDLDVTGYPARGKIAIESLSDDEIGFSVLDALRFSQSDDGPEAVVTTDALLAKWLSDRAQWWKKSGTPLPEVEDALKTDDFYTEALGPDAAFSKNADIPIRKPEGASFAAALLGGWAQDIGPNPAQEIIVALRKDGKVYIASETTTRAGKIPACDAIWTEAAGKAEKLAQKYSEGGAKDEKLIEESMALQEKGDADYRACFAERAPKEPFFPELLKEAQAIADRFGGKQR